VEAIVVEQIAARSALLIGKLLLGRHDGVAYCAFNMSLEMPYDIPPEGGQAIYDGTVLRKSQ
jgi:hypothetical protein